MGTWLNNDGLYIKMGTDEGTEGRGGAYSTLGPLQCVEVKFLATDLADATQLITSDVTVIPSGVRIEEVDVVAEVLATSGGSAVLDVGLVRLDRTTEIDFDGLVADLALASINVSGEKNVLRVGSTGAGALVGTTTANPGFIVASYDTAAFTAGKIAVRVYFYNPQTVG